MNNNQFTTRGINKKTGKFVFGYYVSFDKRHFIISKDSKIGLIGLYKDKSKHKDLRVDNIIEIKQAPDRWTTKYDKNKNKIWENDKYKVSAHYEGDYKVKEHIEVCGFDSGFPSDIMLMGCYESPSQEDIEVIGNTHKELNNE